METLTRKAPPAEARSGKKTPHRPQGWEPGPGHPFTPREFSKSYDLALEALSRLTGASPRTVAYWRAGKAPQGSSRHKLLELNRLFMALSDFVKPKSIGPWLMRSNPAFEGSTPLQVIERGEVDRIWKMLWELQEGHSG